MPTFTFYRYKDECGAACAIRKRIAWKSNSRIDIQRKFQVFDTATTLKTSDVESINNHISTTLPLVDSLFDEVAKPRYQNLKFTNYQKRKTALHDLSKR